MGYVQDRVERLVVLQDGVWYDSLDVGYTY